MNAEEFIKKWKDRNDSDGSPLVGIEKNWSNIKLDSKVIQYSGREAWDQIYNFTPPWYRYGMRLNFKNLIESNSKEYQNEIRMEKEKLELNKFNYILEHGLVDPLSPKFLAFAENSGLIGVLGDGCHRFLVADSAIRNKLVDLTEYIEKTELDIICLENFSEVIPFDPFN